MMHSEGQQINVCDPAMGQHLITADGGRRRPGPQCNRNTSQGLKSCLGCSEQSCFGHEAYISTLPTMLNPSIRVGGADMEEGFDQF